MTRWSRLALGLLAPLLALGGAFALSHQVGEAAHSMRASWPADESYVTLPPAESARFAYMGYNELAADVTWARLLVYYGSGFLGEGDFRYLNKFVDNVLALDPRFKKAYQWAAYSVTVTEDHRVSTREEDIRKSIDILEKAMREFPDDYEFFWIAGIRYYLDLKSEDEEVQRQYKERGAEYMEMAMRKPNAPKDLATKAAAFRTQLGQHEQARANLMQMIMTTDDEAARQTMLENFAHIGDRALAEELEEASWQLLELHREELAAVPTDLFILLDGPAPSPVIDFDELATDRDLIGSKDEREPVELFP